MRRYSIGKTTMAEPVGILGTAVGVVSLGIQVYGALQQYLEDFRCRGEQIDKAQTHLKQLKESLDTIDSAIPAFENEHHIPSDRAMSCLQTSRTELAILQAELQSQEATTASDSKGKMKETWKKIGYPFHRKQLVELEDRIHRISSTLSLAIEALELNALSTINKRTISLDRTIQANTGTLACLAAKSDALQLEQTVTNDRLAINHSTLQSVSRNIIDTISWHETHGTTLAEIKTMLQALALQAPSSSEDLIRRNLTGMIVSKPGFQKDIHEATNSFQVEPQQEPPVDSRGAQEAQQQHRHNIPNQEQWAIGSSCGCRPRRQMTYKSTRWWLVKFFDETVDELNHRPWCPLAKANTTKRQRNIGIVSTSLRQLLSVAISAGFSLSYGAGGCSISPTLRYFAMVDENRSPAFRILRIVINLTFYHPKYSIADEDLGKVAEYAISAIRRVYENRAALPTDISECGHTLLQEVLRPSRNRRFLRFRRNLFEALLDLGVGWGNGVPQMGLQFLVDTREEQYQNHFADVNQIIARLSYAVDFQWDLSYHLNYAYVIDYVAHSETLMTALGLDHPILVALLQRNETKLREVLQNRPATVVRQLIADYDWKPLWIATGWPTGLKLLMKTSPDFSEHIKNRRGNAIRVTLSASRQAFSITDKSTIHSGYVYAETLGILLDQRIYLNVKDLGRYILDSLPCLHCLVVLLQHIKEWREKLRSLAHIHLTDVERHQLGIHDARVLDANAAKVVTKLEDKGIFPHKIFGLEPDDYRLSPEHDKTGSTSIYYAIGTREGAEFAFGMGFQDIDACFRDTTPILQQAYFMFWKWSYCDWLIGHGASYSRLVPYYIGSKHLPSPQRHQSFPKYTVAHLLAHSINAHWIKTTKFRQLNQVLSLETEDGCSCGCSSSPNGCTPLTIALNRLCTYYRGPFNSYWATRIIFPWVLGVVDDRRSLALGEAVIRVFTFHHLGIRHTCCCMPGLSVERTNLYRPMFFDETVFDDVAEIQEEDSHLLVQLEELVSELMDEFVRGDLSLEAFIRGPWMARMDKVDKEAQALVLTQQEKDEIRSIRVVLEDTEVEEIGNDAKKPDLVKYQSFEYWKMWIDGIVGGKF
ncbi:hypothetical protein F5X99DRAFT_367251 [Biscogniauxia marginata]|nr:hypothetical protein F5X99DRAFT_367251 [Biscogniauxia marginata]